MEMGTAESRYDKISDFHTECQRLFGHLPCCVQLSGLSEAHGKSTCTHYFRQRTHGSVVDPHSRVFKGEIQPKEQLALSPASWIHFVLIPTDDWPITANETSCRDTNCKCQVSAAFTLEERCFPDVQPSHRHRSSSPQAEEPSSPLTGALKDQNAMFTALLVSTYTNSLQLIGYSLWAGTIELLLVDTLYVIWYI